MGELKKAGRAAAQNDIPPDSVDIDSVSGQKINGTLRSLFASGRSAEG